MAYSDGSRIRFKRTSLARVCHVTRQVKASSLEEYVRMLQKKVCSAQSAFGLIAWGVKSV
eukprot:406034-Pelagomonas_calceolata.AAC.3